MAQCLRSYEPGQPGHFTGPSEDMMRYRLVRSLNRPSQAEMGGGRSAETWQAVDTVTGRQVLVKLLREGASPFEGPLEGEVERLWALERSRTCHPSLSSPEGRTSTAGRRHCVTIFDSFPLPDEGGVPLSRDADPEDVCDAVLVLEWLDFSLAALQQAQPSPFLPTSLVQPIVRQLLHGLDYMHEGVEEGVIAHCKISLDSIHVRNTTGLVQPTLDKGIEVVLADFGSSCWCREGYNSYIVPSNWLFGSPEQFLLRSAYNGFGPPQAIDTWAVGVVVSLLLFDKNLALLDLDPEAVPHPPNPASELEWYSARPELVINLASLDREAGWPAFFEQTTLRRTCDSAFPFNLPGVVPLPSLRDRILAEPVSSSFSTSDVDLLTSFLRTCWTLDPYKRPSAKELLEHEWMKGGEEEKE